MPSLTPFLSRQFLMCSKNTSHRARLLSPSSSVDMTCSSMRPHAPTSCSAPSLDTARPCLLRPRWCSSRAFFFRSSFYPVRRRTISCLTCDGLLAIYLVLQNVDDEHALMGIGQREAILLHPELPAGKIFFVLSGPLSNIHSTVDRIGRQHIT